MTPSDHILSVSELNRRARQLLEVHLATVWVRGEISNLAMPSSGHWYFTLKDSRSQIRCAMFRGNNALLRFRPEHGMQVIARGRISLYEGRGDYQLIVENLTADGTGDLQIAFEQLKNRLEDEGLFAGEFKQQLPALPKHIAVITSPTGAVIRDIIAVFKRRFPATLISILPVPVQGTEAAAAIACAIQKANTQSGIDAIILARGGGSLEDLWAFNEEVVARAVFASEIPIVSAVGHETDYTICDFVADVRAPTPSAAAELLSTDANDIAALLSHYQDALQALSRRKIARCRNDLLNLVKRLRHPGHTLREQQQRMDHLEWRLLRACEQHFQTRQLHLAKLGMRLQRQNPATYLAQLNQRAAWHQQRMKDLMLGKLLGQRQQIQHLSAMLDNLSPLHTLQRGYTIARSARGEALTSATQLQPGQTLRLILHQGQVDCTVQAVYPDIALQIATDS